jgi:hypothetical protein
VWAVGSVRRATASSATERYELRCAGLVVREGANALRPGIAAVTARLESGTLRVVEGRCPNLLAEAGLYRYSDDPRGRRGWTQRNLQQPPGPAPGAAAPTTCSAACAASRRC